MNKQPFHFALREIGVSEVAGQGYNERIIAYHSSVTGNFTSDEIAWCSSFVNFCFDLSGEGSRTHSALSQSWLDWGIETKFPKIGDIVILTNKKNKKWGHVGFFIDQTDTQVLILGGNQGDSVSFKWFSKDGKSLKLNCFKTWA